MLKMYLPDVAFVSLRIFGRRDRDGRRTCSERRSSKNKEIESIL
jgi:hypothetical protein